MNIKKLQNGSDIRGIALEGVKGESINLTPKIASFIGYSFAQWLSKKTNKKISDLKIAIGNDSRKSANALRDGLIKGLSRASAHLFISGLSSTPAMFMSTQFNSYDCDGAIMITASHLPFNRNGFKFFTKKGGLDKKDIKAILEMANDITDFPLCDTLNTTTIDLMGTYASMLVQKVRESCNTTKPLNGLNIIVDAGNGAGGFYAKDVLVPLGANIDGSQFLQPDGMFPNHIPNPEDKAAMESIKSAVINNQADLGIIFDTDVDRAAIVDKGGIIINRNKLIALLSAIVAQEHPGTTIVTDSVTSNGLADFLNNIGLTHHRFKRGYKNVINESIRLNTSDQDSQLAIETSGHGAFKENYFLDDGAYIVTKILIKLAQLAKSNDRLSDLIKDLKLPVSKAEFRLDILCDDFQNLGETVIASLEKYIDKHMMFTKVEPNYEGIRAKTKDGWFLLRLSLHDPVLPLNIESDTEDGVNTIIKELVPFFEKYDTVDSSTLLK